MAASVSRRALEHEVGEIRALEAALAATGSRGGSYSLRIDRHYRRVMAMLEPRIAWLTRRYGLGNWREDAAQACAIGIYRAVGSWEPERAGFSTLVHWQMRGELQALRHRVMLDRRPAAQAAAARTVSMFRDDGRTVGELAELDDREALPGTERQAADAMAGALLRHLLDRIGSPARERAIVEAAVFAPDGGLDLPKKTRETHRQIVRRTLRNCAKVAADPVGSSQVRKGSRNAPSW